MPVIYHLFIFMPLLSLSLSFSLSLALFLSLTFSLTHSRISLISLYISSPLFLFHFPLHLSPRPFSFPLALPIDIHPISHVLSISPSHYFLSSSSFSLTLFLVSNTSRAVMLLESVSGKDWNPCI